MNQDSQSSLLPSEEQKRIADSQKNICIPFLSDFQKADLNQSLGRFSSDKNQSRKEDISLKSGKKGKRAGYQLKYMNKGHWSTEQNKKYHWFLEIHYKHFVHRHMRRTDKIFKTMEIFVGTRQAEQCRSHHQKMEKKYLNFVSIISNLREIHYATQDTTLMQQQLEVNQIQIVNNLATIHQLKAYKKQEDETKSLSLKKLVDGKPAKQGKLFQKMEQSQAQIKLQVKEQYKQRQNQDNCEGMNMFDQSRINLGQIMIYQVKEEENSCIFQSMFQH